MSKKHQHKAKNNPKISNTDTPSESSTPTLAPASLTPEAPQGFTLQQNLLALVIIMACSFILYASSISYGYVLDDKLVYVNNDFTTGGMEGIWKLLSTESFTGYFGDQKTLVQGSRYRPLSMITFNIEAQIFGINPRVSHLLNILIYGFTAFICFITLGRLFSGLNSGQGKDSGSDSGSGSGLGLGLVKGKGKGLSGTHVASGVEGRRALVYSPLIGLAFLTSMIFLFHPLHVEAVANVKGRDEIMSLLLSMLSLWAALQYMDKQKWYWLLSTGILFFLGLLAKENTLTFLAVIPFGLFLFRKGQTRQLLSTTGVLIGVSIVYIIVRLSVIGYLLGEAPSNDIMNNSFAGMSSPQKYATIFYTLLEYLRLNVFPHPLTHDYYPYHIPIMSFGDWQVWVSIIFHILLIGVGLLFWKKNKVVTFAIAYYFATMSIVSNLVISIGTFMNERFAFAASMATCLLIALGILAIANSMAKRQHKNRWATILLAIPILGLLGAKTMTRVPVWESELTLNRAAIKVSKNSARANSFMATALFNKYKEESDINKKMQLLQEAEPYAVKAIDIHPMYYNGNLMRVGIAAEKYKYNKSLKGLLDDFLTVVDKRPDVEFIKTYLEYLNPREDKNLLLDFYKSAAGDILINQQRKYDWAIYYLNLALQVDPNDPEIRSLMRKAYIGLGQPEKANKYK